MRLSATMIGRTMGLTARAVNVLLKEHGYLYGEPGAYGLTEKGAAYGHETWHHRGPGGYAHYNRDWETRSWSEGILDVLAADIAAGSSGDASASSTGSSGSTGVRLATAVLPAVALSVLAAGARLAGPRLKAAWSERCSPTTRRTLDRRREAPGGQRRVGQEQQPSGGCADPSSERSSDSPGSDKPSNS